MRRPTSPRHEHIGTWCAPCLDRGIEVALTETLRSVGFQVDELRQELSDRGQPQKPEWWIRVTAILAKELVR